VQQEREKQVEMKTSGGQGWVVFHKIPFGWSQAKLYHHAQWHILALTFPASDKFPARQKIAGDIAGFNVESQALSPLTFCPRAAKMVGTVCNRPFGIFPARSSREQQMA
jgi:hypothetical protein